jgi:hypothetical protein
MMTTKDFRRIALGLKGAVEGAHMGHADFRAHGRIFATLQSAERGMVKLTPGQQADFVAAAPDAFVPESGAWGRQGCTRVLFAAVDEEALGEAMTLAWRNAATASSPSTPKRPTTRRSAARRKG